MSMPNMSQGKPRALPDGFLHLNNYSHVRQSGLAGVLYERVFTQRQQEIVEAALLELGEFHKDYHFKHNVWRFRKEFLHEYFIGVVYGTTRLLRKGAAAMMSIAIVEEELKHKPSKVSWPKG